MPEFTEDHVWPRVLHGVATVHAVTRADDRPGGLVHVTLPTVEPSRVTGETAAATEPVLAGRAMLPSDDPRPPTGGAVADTAVIVNANPEGGACFVRLQRADPRSVDGRPDRDADRTHLG